MLLSSLAAGTMIACNLMGAPIEVADVLGAADGNPDCAPGLQAKLDACATAGGGVVELAQGRYALRGPVTVPAGVTLKGQWNGPHFSTLAAGTVIEVAWGAGQEDGPPQFMLGESSTLQGLTLFYPEQDAANIQPYPWTVQGRGTHLNVFDCTFVNPYKAIDFASFPHEMHYIRNVYGCPLKVGVSLDQCTDIGRVENVHFNPNAWTRSGAPNAPTGDLGARLVEFMQANLTAFEIGRSDWEMMVNTFSWGSHIGYRFYGSVDKPIPGPTNGDFLGIAADWSVIPLLIEESQAPGLLITNGQFVGSPACEAVIDVKETHTGVVQLANCSFWGPHQIVVRNTGPGQVSLSQCNFVQWDAADKGMPAVDMLAGSLTVQGCIFRQDKPAVRLGPECRGAVIMGCQSRRALIVDDQTEGQVEQIGNIAYGG